MVTGFAAVEALARGCCRCSLVGGIRVGPMLVDVGLEAVKSWRIGCREREIVPGRCSWIVEQKGVYCDF